MPIETLRGKSQVYKTFMEILHTFQKDQKTVKDTTQHGPMCETEVRFGQNCFILQSTW